MIFFRSGLKEVLLWNGKAVEDNIFKRLDRMLINQELLGMFGNVEIEYLAKIYSVHIPLLLTCGRQASHFIRPYRFLKF